MSFQYSKYGCIISIDFGTTFSGSCYAITGGLTDKQIRVEKNLVKTADLNSKLKSLNNINIAQVSFKITQAAEKQKTPTIVIYDQYRQLSSWGIYAKLKIDDNKVSASDKVLKEFKLHLPKSVSQKGSVQRPGSMEQNPEDNNLRATIDFFKVVYDHIYESLYNERISKAYSFDNENIRFIITVPAMWTDIERAVMRQVAIQAGLINEADHEARLLIINESLAATLYSERELAVGLIREGDKYIVCDAGGGTVDIAAFIKTKEEKENISFDRCQLTADSGAECGSTFIDKAMSALLSLVLYNTVIDKTTDTTSLSQAEKKIVKDRKMALEKLIDIFVNGDNTTIKTGKHLFGQELEDDDINLPDEHYEKLDAEGDYESIRYRATVFQEFELEDHQKIDDKNYVLKRYDEFKIWKKYDLDNEETDQEDERIYVNKHGILWKDFKLVIPFSVMVKYVFKKVIDETLVLLERQINKVGGEVKATFLVGGLGRNHYLKRNIMRKFGEKAGKVGQNVQGDLAAMRGAAYYGIDGVKRPEQTDIAEFPYKDETFVPENYDTVICIDVGYDHTSCSYINLTHENGDQTEQVVDVKGWPSADKNATQIPTAFQKDDGKWGAQVLNTTNVEQEKLIVPSRLMSIVKGDLKTFLVGFLHKVNEHICQQIKNNEDKKDRSKFRYCITMENSYKFFNRKSDMRRICEEAKIVPEGADPRRLLLFRREDAAAMYFENTQLSLKKYSTYFLQVFFRHDSCHLALQESIKISGFVESKAEAEQSTEPDSKYFRNVRGVRSATLEFNFVAKLIANLDMFITKNPCITCSAIIRHDDYYSSYYSDLRRGFLEYVKDRLDFSSNEHNQQITIRDNCCVISISVYDILEHVFRPAIRDLVSEINRHVTQTDINNFRLDNIFLVDKLFKAQPNTYEFLERIFIKTLAEVMNIGNDLIKPAEEINVAAIKGALLYGADPRKYTERVARKTYMITVKAVPFKDFKDSVKKEVATITDEDEIYDIESKNAFQEENGELLDLYYQPAYNPSKKFKVGPSYQNLLIPRGKKITEADQVNGIQKRFFAEKECLVHATIYTSEANDLEFPPPENPEAATIDTDIPTHFQKIHQFEIYIKADPNDPMNKFGHPRHYFDVRMIPDNNEIKFEANIGTRVGEKIPEFRFRDEILVANIYGDESDVYLKETSRQSAEEVVNDTAVGESKNAD